MGKNNKIKWDKVGKFVLFKNKKFYFPYKCLCCGIIISKEQFCFGRCCAYCDLGRCQTNNGYEKRHGRKDILENAEDMEDEFNEMVKEKLKKIKMGKKNNANTEILNPNCSEVIWRLDVKRNTREEILKVLEDEDDEDDDTFVTGREYPDGCLDEMLEKLDGAMDIDNAKLIFEDSQGLEGADEYTKECFEIAKRVINREITKVEADVLGKGAWDENVIIEEDDY